MYDSPGPGQEPNLNSGIAGFQMATSNVATNSGKGILATSTAPRAKPNVPQKKTHIDELLRLRKELEDVKEASCQAYEERNAMEDDLLKLHDDAEERDEELKKKEDDLLKLHHDFEKKDKEFGAKEEELRKRKMELREKEEELKTKDEELKKMSREVWTWREKAEKPPNDAENGRRLAAQSRRSIGRGVASLPVATEANGRIEKELVQAQQQIEQLTAALADSDRRSFGADAISPLTREVNERNEKELAQARQQIHQLTAALADLNAQLSAKNHTVTAPEASKQAAVEEAQRAFQTQLAQVEDHWRAQIVEEQRRRQAAESGRQSSVEYYENRLKDVESETRRQIEEQQRQLQAETALQDQSQQMEIDSGGNEELERLRRVAAELEGMVNEQRQRAEQFRRMSERLTTQVKQAQLAKRGFEQSEQAKRYQAEDMKSQSAARRPQHNINMPGSYQFQRLS